MEKYLKRAMVISNGDAMVFFERPISATLLAVTAAILALTILGMIRSQRRAQEVPVA